MTDPLTPNMQKMTFPRQLIPCMSVEIMDIVT